MKKIFMTALGLMGLTTLNAQTVEEVKDFGFTNSEYYLNKIPAKFTVDGKGLIVLRSMNEEGGYQFIVLDTKFNEIKTFTLDDYLSTNVNDMNEADDEEYSYRITQTLFNSDSKFEYMRLNDEIEGSYDLYGSVSIIQDDGTVLHTFMPAEGCDAIMYDDVISVMICGDDIYVIVVSYNSENGNRVMTVYRWQENGTRVERVREYNGTRAYPNPVARHDQLTVEVPEGEGQAEIVVTNMAGQTVKHLNANSGKVMISTSNLSRGQYNVTVTRNGKAEESCKVIVK